MCRLLLNFTIVLFLSLSFSTSLQARESFISYELFPDNAGDHINAHGAGVMEHKGVYYLYGESKGRGNARGVSCYKSVDLYNWENMGLVLTTVDLPGHDLEPGCIIERPKVVYNQKTDSFVLWFHLELRGKGYTAARTAVASAKSPTGPFVYIKSFRPNQGIWPMNYPQLLYKAYLSGIDKADGFWASDGFIGNYLNRDMETGQMARDMTVFLDDDGKAYHIHSSEENQTLHICELTDDFLNFTGRYTRVLPGESNEAPAICKYQGKYYMISSGCTGWSPNEARSAVAPTIWGPWTSLGNPCLGVNPHNKLGPEKTWGGQSTHLLPVTGNDGCYIAMFDLWRPQNQQDSRYLWLPAYISDGKIKIQWQDNWALDWFEKKDDKN